MKLKLQTENTMPSRQKMEFIDKDGNAVDEDTATIRDGFGVRVRVNLMDGAPRTLVTDAFGGPAGHAPGYCFAADARRSDPNADDPDDEAERARDEFKQRVSNAWRSVGAGPGNVAPGPASVGARPSDARKTCEDALAARDAYLRDAWRTPR